MEFTQGNIARGVPVRRVDAVQTETVTATSRNIIRLDLKRDMVFSEHVLAVSVSQVGFTVVPTSFDIGRFFERVTFQTADGERYNLTGKALAEFSRFFEQQSTPRVTLAATSTADFSLEIHHELVDDLMDYACSLLGYDYSQLTVELTPAPVTDNGFIGGTTPGNATYTVRAISYGQRGWNYANLPDAQGNVRMPDLGEAVHYVRSQFANISANGSGEFLLKGDVRARTYHLICEDFTGGVHVSYMDTLLSNLRLNVAGDIIEARQFLDLKDENEHERGYISTGVSVIDFGDNLLQSHLDLRGIKDVRLEYDVIGITGGVTAGRIELIENYSKGL